jgi:hypothetical protein
MWVRVWQGDIGVHSLKGGIYTAGVAKHSLTGMAPLSCDDDAGVRPGDA